MHGLIEMELTYRLTKDDYLDYSMYTSSISKVQRRTRQRSYWFVLIVYGVFGLVALLLKAFIGAAIVWGAAIAWFFLYPHFSKFRYRNHFRKSIEEQLKEHASSEITIKFEDEGIYSKDEMSEGTIFYSSVQAIVELRKQYLILLPKTVGLVLPKSQFSDDQLSSALQVIMERTNLSITDHTEKSWW